MVQSKGLRSGTLAKAAEVSPDTIRHYEKIGVLPRASRTAIGGSRHVVSGSKNPNHNPTHNQLIVASLSHRPLLWSGALKFGCIRPTTFHCIRFSLEIVAGALALICLDTYMLYGVYQESGICVRNHCGAEPPRDIEPPGLVTTVGGRDRASASYAAADRVKAPASAARGRFRGIHGGRTAPSLPAET